MSEKLLDYKEALERLGDDSDFLNELLLELISQVDKSFEKFKTAIENNDYSSLKSLAHNLKGASANLNVTRMSTHFFDLEKLASSESCKGAQNILKLVAQDKIELEEFLKNEIDVN